MGGKLMVVVGTNIVKSVARIPFVPRPGEPVVAG